MKYDFTRQIFLHQFNCVMYATTYVKSSHLVSTRKVPKLQYYVWTRLVKRLDGQCLCSSRSVISDGTVTGATPYWFCKAGVMTQHSGAAYMLKYIGLREWISIGSGNGWPPVRCQEITQSHSNVLSIAPLDGACSFRLGVACRPSFH